jgi:hypothetical protein
MSFNVIQLTVFNNNRHAVKSITFKNCTIASSIPFMAQILLKGLELLRHCDECHEFELRQNLLNFYPAFEFKIWS